MAIAEIYVCAQTVILVWPPWHLHAVRAASTAGHWQFSTTPSQCLPNSPEAQWQAGNSRGACGGQSRRWAAGRDPSANGRFVRLNGASILRYRDASRQQPYGVPKSPRKSCENHSRRHRKSTWKQLGVVAKMEPRKTSYAHCALCLHRPPTSAQSPPSPTTSSRSLLSSERSLLFPSYRLQRHPRWHGRRLSNTAS